VVDEGVSFESAAVIKSAAPIAARKGASRLSPKAPPRKSPTATEMPKKSTTAEIPKKSPTTEMPKRAPVAAPRAKKNEKVPSKPAPSSKESSATSAADPLAALRPSSAGSSKGKSREPSKSPSRLPQGEAYFVIPDEEDNDESAIPGTRDLRKSFTRKDSTRMLYKRDYYINRKSVKGSSNRDVDNDDAVSIASTTTSISTTVSSPRKDREEEEEEDEDEFAEEDLYVIPSSGHEKTASYAGVHDIDDDEDATILADRRRRGDGSSSFGSSFGSASEIDGMSPGSRQQQQQSSSWRKVRELSEMWDRRGSLPSVNDAKSGVEDFLRMGSITGRSLTKKGRELIQEVVRPSSASNPVRKSGTLMGSGAGGSNTSLASSLRSSFRSSIRSFAGMKVSNVDEDRTTPDGASIGGEEEEAAAEEENAIYV